MTTPIFKSLIDEQIDEMKATPVCGPLQFPVGVRVADLPYRRDRTRD